MSDRRISSISLTIAVVAGAILAVFLAVFLIFYFKPVASILIVRWQVRNEPDLWIVPRPLPAPTNESPARKTFSYFGCEFDSPWSEVKQQVNFGPAVRLVFSGGQVIAILDPARQANALQIFRQGAARRKANVATVFGKDATQSNYALRSAIVNLTPADLRFYISPNKMVDNAVFLLLKPISTTNVKHGFYSFQTNWIRGFQQGDPARDEMVVIDGFDGQDREIVIVVGVGHGTINRASQADINRITYSLRPISASDAK